MLGTGANGLLMTPEQHGSGCDNLESPWSQPPRLCPRDCSAHTTGTSRGPAPYCRRRRGRPPPKPPGRPTGPRPAGRVPAAGQGGARRACALPLRAAPANLGALSNT